MDLGESRSPTQFSQRNLQPVSRRFGRMCAHSVFVFVFCFNHTVRIRSGADGDDGDGDDGDDGDGDGGGGGDGDGTESTYSSRLATSTSMSKL